MTMSDRSTKCGDLMMERHRHGVEVMLLTIVSTCGILDRSSIDSISGLSYAEDQIHLHSTGKTNDCASSVEEPLDSPSAIFPLRTEKLRPIDNSQCGIWSSNNLLVNLKKMVNIVALMPQAAIFLHCARKWLLFARMTVVLELEECTIMPDFYSYFLNDFWTRLLFSYLAYPTHICCKSGVYHTPISLLLAAILSTPSHPLQSSPSIPCSRHQLCFYPLE
ncbi:hypothetical protein STEG23_029085 [Scotinomys teguina]